MTVRPILIFPDPRLRVAAEPVVAFDADLRQLVMDLTETLNAAQGLGITACHIGIARRVVVIDLPDAGTYINPRITEASTETIRHEEGSVSMPGVADLVERPARVTVSYQDLGGNQHIAEAEGLLSVCLQHEIDQLDGVFWIYRLSRLKRDRLVKRFEKLARR